MANEYQTHEYVGGNQYTPRHDVGATQAPIMPDTGGLEVNAHPETMGAAATVFAQHPAGPRRPEDQRPVSPVGATGVTPQTSTPQVAPVAAPTPVTAAAQPQLSGQQVANQPAKPAEQATEQK